MVGNKWQVMILNSNYQLVTKKGLFFIVKYLQFNSNIELRLRDEINEHSKFFPFTVRLQIHHISWQNLHRNCRIAAYLLPERVAIIPENVPS